MPTWVRVRIKGTGHEVDVREDAVQPSHEVLKDYPENSGPTAVARPAKIRVTKAGTSAKTSKEN